MMHEEHNIPEESSLPEELAFPDYAIPVGTDEGIQHGPYPLGANHPYDQLDGYEQAIQATYAPQAGDSEAEAAIKRGTMAMALDNLEPWRVDTWNQVAQAERDLEQQGPEACDQAALAELQRNADALVAVRRATMAALRAAVDAQK